MHYFYIKEVFSSAGMYFTNREQYRLYAAKREMEYKAVPWPYEAMYCDTDSFLFDKIEWLEKNSELFVVSEIRNHRGGKMYGGARYEIWIDNDEEALQFKLMFC
jgi:hypothetical protein